MKNLIKNFMPVFKAVLSAMVGIGKRKNLARDFARVESRGALSYIIVGLTMTAIFIMLVVIVVNFVLA